jgi:hypothetical protein
MSPPYDEDEADDEGGADLALVFGPPKKKGEKKDEADEVPAEFDSAYSEWKADPGPETMWRMIKSCVGGDS